MGNTNRGRSPASDDRARRAGRRPWARTALVLLAASVLGGGIADAALYKWVDEKGVTHYTDKMPPDAVDKASTELSRQGVAIKKTAPASSPDERKARREEAERQREAAKQQQEAAQVATRRARALRDSYTTESDIDLAKNRSLRTIQAALESAEAYTAVLTKRKAGFTASKEALAGKPAPATLERDLASTEAEIARQADFIARKRQDLVTVAAKYDADKARWRALDSESATPSPPAPGSTAARK